ncbi:hypothetical protein [Dactylosporangium sp. CA-233914]|uniref:hypothetical protein n=1 Tax=Dactylosporangium sp. CA-233914 TaxID=3239934 RepID=UPI003D8A9FFD
MRSGKCLILVVAATALMTSCADKTEKSATTVSAPSSPAVVDAGPQLAAAAAKSSATTYHFRAEDPGAGGTIEGAADPKAAASTATMSVALDESNKLTFESITTGGAFFLKITGLPATGGVDLSKYWLKADPAKLTGAVGLLDAKDPIDVQGIVAGVTNVKHADGTLYTGTIDLTKSSTGIFYDEELAKQLGDKAKAVPFGASVDAEGYLNSIRVSAPAYGTEPATDTTVTLTDFGRPVTATAPTGTQVIAMPEQMYTVLNEK